MQGDRKKNIKQVGNPTTVKIDNDTAVCIHLTYIHTHMHTVYMYCICRQKKNRLNTFSKGTWTNSL